MSKSRRGEKAAALERWADNVAPGDVLAVDTSVLRQLAKLADQLAEPDSAVTMICRDGARPTRRTS